MGYHKKKIKKGVFGEFSKIQEEFQEFEDAIEQEASIMALVELSDILAAIEGYLKKNHPSITLKDVIKMSKLTQGAFADGTRRSK